MRKPKEHSRLGLLFTSDEHYAAATANVYLDSAHEAQIQAAIMDYLHARGWAVLELSQPARVVGGIVGAPDLVAWRFDEVAAMTICILFENKTRRGKLRASQEEFRARMLPHLSSTLFHIVPHSVDEAMKFIDEVMR